MAMKNIIKKKDNIVFWDQRAKCEGLHCVFSRRWSAKECNLVNKKQIQYIFSLLPDLKDKTVLDLGCGIGRLTGLLAQKSLRVIGLDSSKQMIERARLELSSLSIEFIHASVSSIPIPDAFFDVIVGVFILQHVLDQSIFRKALREIKRLTKIGGLVLFFDGIGEKTYRPPNSSITIIRTISQYERILNPYFKLLKCKDFDYVHDQYTAMLWKRVK